jgi:hypothetical protein
MLLEGLGQLKKVNHHTGNGTHGLPACVEFVNQQDYGPPE